MIFSEQCFCAEVAVALLGNHKPFVRRVFAQQTIPATVTSLSHSHSLSF